MLIVASLDRLLVRCELLGVRHRDALYVANENELPLLDAPDGL